MKPHALVVALLAPLLILAAAPAVSAEPCISHRHTYDLPFHETPERSTPGVNQHGKDVTVDPPQVGPFDVGPTTVSTPPVTIDPIRVPSIQIHEDDEYEVEFEYCILE